MLSQFEQLAYRAWQFTSFSPEKRAKDAIEGYGAELKADLEHLKEATGSTGNYELKYKRYFSAWLAANGRCISSMITGPSNFPVDRARKANAREHSAYENWRAWRAKYIKRATAERTKSPEEDLDIALKDYDKQFEHHEAMKIANAIIRKHKTEDERREAMESAGFGKKLIDIALTPDCYGGIGFGSYQLTNSNATLKRLLGKIATMKARIARKETFEPIEFDGGIITIEADRVIISHETKPDPKTLQELKSSGFHWSGKYKSWSRKHTLNALNAAKRICLPK